MIHPVLGLVLVLASLLGLLVGLKTFQARFSPHPEVSRKILHTSMGLVILSFPWLFRSTWPVWVLAVLSIALLIAIRVIPLMNRHFAKVVGGVERKTLGDIYFPLAVAILFELVEGNTVFFLIPVLLLTFADAVAALIGIRYGAIEFQSGASRKTLEGSFAFFIVAFISVQVPLMIMTDIKMVDVLLISLVLAFLVMLFEAVASHGLDNLFIPIGGYLLLQAYISTDTHQLIIRVIVIAILMLVIFFLRRRTALDQGAAIAVVLVLFVTWSLMPWTWMLAPLALLMGYVYYAVRDYKLGKNMHSVNAVLSVSAVALLWIALSLLHGSETYRLAYSLSYAAHLAMIGVAHMNPVLLRKNNLTIVLESALPGLLLVVLPFLLLSEGSMNFMVVFLFSLLAIIISAVLFLKLQPGINDCPVTLARWVRQAAIAGLVSTVGLLV